MASTLTIEQWLVIGIVIAMGVVFILHIIASTLKYENDLVRLRIETHRLREEFLQRKKEREVVAVVDPVDDDLMAGGPIAMNSGAMREAA